MEIVMAEVQEVQTPREKPWTEHDISNERWRRYHYGDGQVLKIDRPKKLLLIKDHINGDRHRLIVTDPSNVMGTTEVGMYIKPGWLAISWQGHNGEHAVGF